MSNFDQFVPKDATTTEGGSTEGGAVDAGCDATAACIGTATTCGNNCRDVGAQCVANCGNPGCKNNCMQTESNCLAKCRSDCVTCAGASCTTPCQTAVGN